MSNRRKHVLNAYHAFSDAGYRLRLDRARNQDDELVSVVVFEELIAGDHAADWVDVVDGPEWDRDDD
jgi:hypothetical protein